MRKLLMLAVVAAAALAFAPVYGVSSGELEHQLAPARANFPTEHDNQTVIDANRVMMFVTNVGLFAFDQTGSLGRNDGLYFPRGTDLTAVYCAGLWLGGKSGDELRVSVAEYGTGFVPGPMAGGTFLPDDPSYKVYKIFKELREDGFYDDPRPVGDPDLEELWDDYHNWPAGMGAPVGGDDQPAILGDQTLWCLFNDADPAKHINDIGTSEGLGIEVQQTVFAYDTPGPLGNCIFMRYFLINKSGNPISELYTSFWGDPDVGDPADDYAGCDSMLGIGYAYNATVGDNRYGAETPAVGFCLLQGPEVPSTNNKVPAGTSSFSNLPMTAYTSSINETEPDSARETYWYMQGLDAENSGNPFIDPTNSMVTTYMYNGDPVADNGWLDCCTQSKMFFDADIQIYEIAGPAGVLLDPPWDVGCQWNSTSEFYVTSDVECDLSRINWLRATGEGSWEFRFGPGGSEYYEWWTREKYGDRAPFEVWNIGINTPDDPSDDVRIQFAIVDDDESGGYTPGDRVYPFESAYSEPLPQQIEASFYEDFQIGRIKFAGSAPQEGTVARISAANPDTSYDTVSHDCRYLVSSGPCDIADADTQEIWMAIVLGQGADRLSSVIDMKNAAVAAREAFAAGFAICDCGVWGDVNDDGNINPLDIVYMVNAVYKNQDARVHPPYCPYEAGDADCNGQTNPIDVVYFVSLVYKNQNAFCDPCVD